MVDIKHETENSQDFFSLAWTCIEQTLLFAAKSVFWQYCHSNPLQSHFTRSIMEETPFADEQILILDALDSDGASHLEQPFVQATACHHLGHKWKQFWSRNETVNGAGFTSENDEGSLSEEEEEEEDSSNASSSMMMQQSVNVAKPQKALESPIPSPAPTFRFFQVRSPVQEVHRKRFKRNSRMLVVDHRYDPPSKANGMDADANDDTLVDWESVDPRILADMEKQQKLQAQRSAEAKAERDAIARNQEAKRQAALKKKAQREKKRRAANEIQRQRDQSRKAHLDKRIEADRKKQAELEAKRKSERQMSKRIHNQKVDSSSKNNEDTTTKTSASLLSRKQQKARDDEKWNELKALRAAERRAAAEKRRADREAARLAKEDDVRVSEEEATRGDERGVVGDSSEEKAINNESAQSIQQNHAATRDIPKGQLNEAQENSTPQGQNEEVDAADEQSREEDWQEPTTTIHDDNIPQALGIENDRTESESVLIASAQGFVEEVQGVDISTNLNETSGTNTSRTDEKSSTSPLKQTLRQSHHDYWLQLTVVVLVLLLILRFVFGRKKTKSEVISKSFAGSGRSVNDTVGSRATLMKQQDEEVCYMLHIISFDVMTFLAGEVLTCWEPFTMDQDIDPPPDTLLIEEGNEDALEMSDDENEVSSLVADPTRKVSVHVHYLLVNYLNGLLRNKKLQRRTTQMVADEHTNSTSYQILGLGAELMREISEELREMGIGSKIGVLYASPLKIMKLPDKDSTPLDAPQSLLETHPHSARMSGEGSVASLAEYTVDTSQHSSVASESGRTIGSTAAVASESEEPGPLPARGTGNILNSSYEERSGIDTIDRSVTPIRSNVRQSGYGPDHPRSIASNPQSPSISEQEIVFSSNQSIGESIAGSVGNKSMSSASTYLFGEHWINSRHLCMPRDGDEESDPALVMGRREPQ